MPRQPKASEQESSPLPLEAQLLNLTRGKYELIPLAARWAKQLTRREEHLHSTQAQVLDKALEDVLSGKVTWENLPSLAVDGIESPLEDSSEKPTNSKTKKISSKGS
ncbi:MAG: hypothetical protein HY402_00910 [Elusimicrobia bacterium]|nr:hypothetical protein [Elusimicrobiota bacterium]